jgi:hypothetical protein
MNISSVFRSNRKERSLSTAVSITDEAQAHSPVDRIGGTWSWVEDGRLPLKTLMGADRVVVFDERGQDTTQALFVEDQNEVETLFTNGAHPAFGESIG